MDKDLALQVWNDLHPLPASLLRVRFNGKTDPVYSVAVNAQEMSGRDVHTVLKVADSYGLAATVRGSSEWTVEIVIYKDVAAS
jgi:hypothetical protein